MVGKRIAFGKLNYADDGNSIKSFLLYVKHFPVPGAPRCSTASTSFISAS